MQLGIFPAPLCAAVTAVPELGLLEEEWCALERRSSAAFFTSWGWISTWLFSLPQHLQPQLLRLTLGSQTVGLGILVQRKYWRHHFLPVHEMHLHATGLSEIDTLTIEYNGLLLDRNIPQRNMSNLLSVVLKACSTEELHISGAVMNDYWETSLPIEYSSEIHRQKCYGVDLKQVQASQAYLPLIHANTRAKIRRAMKAGEAIGSLRLTEAKNSQEAESMYEKLCQLHIQTWQARGKPGAFASTYLYNFHLQLIRTQFEKGSIQIISLHAGMQLLGLIYNFIHLGKVYNYQAGIDYSLDSKHLKPGLMIHTMAIEHNAKLGHVYYDFMTGESQYKRSLATDTGQLQWIVFQQAHWKFQFERKLKQIKSFLFHQGRAENTND